jgi:hypothetical protein
MSDVIRDRPFNLKGGRGDGGLWFKKYSDVGGGKKKI